MDGGKNTTMNPIGLNRKEAYMLFSIPLVFFLVITLIAVSQINPVLESEENMIKEYFHNWEDNPYVAGVHDCSDMSKEVEKYWEVERGYNCHIIYGHHKNKYHVWNIVNISGTWYEFESTCLSFQKTSEKYKIDYVIYGDYIDGSYWEHNESLQKLVHNWEDLLR